MRPSKPVCNHLHFAGATTYILGLQLSTFIFCNKQSEDIESYISHAFL